MERVRQIDIIKGIAITLMVIGHCEVPWKRYIYLFHMAVFIIASGYCFRDEHVKDFKHFLQFILKKIRALWLPYFVITALYWMGNNAFLYLNFYADSAIVNALEVGIPLGVSMYMTPNEIFIKIIKAAFFGTFTYMGSSMWFLKVLFIIVCLYGFISWLIYSITHSTKLVEEIQGLIAIILSILGFYLSKNRQVIYGVEIACSCYILFYLGVFLKRHFKEQWVQKSRWFLCPAAAVALCVCNQYHAVELSENQYGNPAFLILVSVLGWFMLWAVAYVLNDCHPIEKIIHFIGCYTLEILVLHVLCFKFVNLILVRCMNLPEYMTAAFPVLDLREGWWLLFTIVGVGLPLFVGWLYDKFKAKLFMRGLRWKE